MAWSRPRALAIAVLLATPGACSDDGVPAGEASEGPQGASDGEDNSDPTITTTASTSLTGGSNGDDADDGVDDDPTADPTDATAAGTTDEADSTAGGVDDTGASDGTTGAIPPVGTGEGSSGESSGTGNGSVPFGGECERHSDCITGVCWDWNDYDMECFGAVCSSACQNAQDCIEQAEAAVAPYPDNAFCGDDGLCVLLESGLGSWSCA